jgi:hypothetical protein
MEDVQHYLDEIVEPTVEEFRRNPFSARHAFLACVATYHAIDRATYPKSASNLRREWSKKSLEFTIVDMVAHHFKHVKSDIEKAPIPTGTIPLSFFVFGSSKSSRSGGKMEVRNLY